MATQQPGLTLQLQPTRRKILLALKKSGGMTAGELSELLGMTAMGIRRHLTTLERDGLVMFDTQQRGFGRPSYLFELTPQAENLFPKTYHILTNELLGYLDEDELGRIFEQRSQRRIRVGRARLSGLDTNEKVAELARMLDEEGYLAEAEQSSPNTWTIHLFNCALLDIAHRFRQACSSELELVRTLLPEAEVQRVHYMMNGDASCTYRITLR
ncbi:MAG: transcriptional regulator [Anaerolineae bacterium]|nr:transcriptional regulator [Anaerolineae bacterium]